MLQDTLQTPAATSTKSSATSRPSELLEAQDHLVAGHSQALEAVLKDVVELRAARRATEERVKELEVALPGASAASRAAALAGASVVGDDADPRLYLLAIGGWDTRKSELLSRDSAILAKGGVPTQAYLRSRRTPTSTS